MLEVIYAKRVAEKPELLVVDGKDYKVREITTTKGKKQLAGKGFVRPDFWDEEGDNYVARYYVPEPETLEELIELMRADSALAENLRSTAYSLFFHNKVGNTLQPLTATRKAAAMNHLGMTTDDAGLKAKIVGTGFVPKVEAVLFDELYGQEKYRALLDEALNRTA